MRPEAPCGALVDGRARPGHDDVTCASKESRSMRKHLRLCAAQKAPRLVMAVLGPAIHAAPSGALCEGLFRGRSHTFAEPSGNARNSREGTQRVAGPILETAQVLARFVANQMAQYTKIRLKLLSKRTILKLCKSTTKCRISVSCDDKTNYTCSNREAGYCVGAAEFCSWREKCGSHLSRSKTRGKSAPVRYCPVCTACCRPVGHRGCQSNWTQSPECHDFRELCGFGPNRRGKRLCKSLVKLQERF